MSKGGVLEVNVSVRESPPDAVFDSRGERESAGASQQLVSE
jgi:hypothetical protein